MYFFACTLVTKERLIIPSIGEVLEKAAQQKSGKQFDRMYF